MTVELDKVKVYRIYQYESECRKLKKAYGEQAKKKVETSVQPFS